MTKKKYLFLHCLITLGLGAAFFAAGLQLHLVEHHIMAAILITMSIFSFRAFFVAGKILLSAPRSAK